MNCSKYCKICQSKCCGLVTDAQLPSSPAGALEGLGEGASVRNLQITVLAIAVTVSTVAAVLLLFRFWKSADVYAEWPSPIRETLLCIFTNTVS